MENKTLHIIPHSHWDREWYMGFERHRMRLVELFDTLNEVMEKDPDYTYYHMDGQYVVIEDYLEIRPQMRERLLKLIKEDRIQIGPWYVLQDEYLTSGESNVRNMLYGIKFCKELGAEPVMSGYFPDAFGNVGQAPQIIRGFGIDNAVFGRGINGEGADNGAAEKKKPSEWIWCSPDGSEVVGIMLANWYSNANELPAEYEALKDRILNIVEACEACSYTPHLLGMNGCDHQPIQTDLVQAIKLSNEILVDKNIKVVQSNFKEYVEAVKPYKDTFPRVTGELNGQGTIGFTLANTASTHIPLKQYNHKVQNLLTQQTEPISAVADIYGDKYREDMIIYAWKKLMQNHPHDSICCCSSDEVTDEMYSRFSASLQTGEYVRDEALDYLKKHVDAKKKSILVFHSTAGESRKVVKAYLDYPLDQEVKGISLKAEDGELIPVSYTLSRNTFTYTLPKDSFRNPKYVNRYEVEFPVTMKGIGYKLFEVVEKDFADKLIKVKENGAENESLSFVIENNGSITLTDKRSGRVYKNLNLFEDSADKGDSYIYSPLCDNSEITTKNAVAEVAIEKETAYSVTFKVKVSMEIPFTHDKVTRSQETIKTDIISFVTLTNGIDRLDIRTEYVNACENHRLRAMFDAGIDTDYSISEGQFDLTRRNIQPWKAWKEPSFCQRSQAFFALENEAYGFAVATRGLHEYEIGRDGKNAAYLTILRAIGEIGDWGVFPTPKMQLKGKGSVEYSVVPYSEENREKAFACARDFSDDAFVTADMDENEGGMKSNMTFVSVDDERISTSAYKKSEDGEYTVLRLYNPYDEEVSFTLTTAFDRLYESNLAENKGTEITMEAGKARITISKKKIVTYLLK